MKTKRLSVMLKPSSSLCQMRCKYCFYHDLDKIDKKPNTIMEEKVVTSLLKEVKKVLIDDGEVFFAFQGGEPLLAGLEFYNNFFDKVKENNINATYLFQTNGILIGDNIEGPKWAKLFKDNNCLVGLSVDGPELFHNENRVFSDGTPTFKSVIKGYENLRHYGVPVNFLTVLTEQVMCHPKELYSFYKEKKVSAVQLIPNLPPLYLNKEYPRLSGKFLNEFFQLWKNDFVNNIPPFEVREFNAIINALKGSLTDTCIFSGICTPQLIIESDGSIYPCDFYAISRYKTGNILENTLDDTLKSDGMKNFANDHESVPNSCKSCKYVKICGGGCRRKRIVIRPDLPNCPIKGLLDEILSALF